MQASILLSWSPSQEIEKVIAGTATGIKILRGASLGLLLLSSVWLLQAS